MPFIAPLVGAVGTAIGAGGSFVAGLGVIGQAAIGIGLSVAVGALQSSRAGKSERTPGGVQFERLYGSAVPRQVACGLVGIAGHDCYVNTYGPSNYELQQVFALSDYPCDGLSRVAINGAWVTLSETETSIRGREVLTGDYAGLVWVKFLDGTQTAVDPTLPFGANPAGRWTADHKGIGVAYVIISMTFNAERLSSVPEFFFEFRGGRFYDWRKDSTAGGSGPHRWGNYGSYEYTENPIVIEYNYRRGISWAGDVFCGMQTSANDLPLTKWTPAANLCDETTSHGRRYRVSILLDCEATHGENIAALQTSCAARTVDAVDGSWPLVGHDQPIVAVITDDDLIANEPVTWCARRSMGDLVNSVAGNHPSPDALWSMIEYETQTSPALVTVDRRDRDLTMDFPQVRSSSQAAQLAAIYLKENRFEGTASIVLRPRWQVLEPGDWIRWASARYGTRVYMVTDVSLASHDADGPRNASVTLQEVDGSIYDGVSPPAIIVPWPPGLPVYLSEVQSFSLIPITLQGADGRLLPGIRAAWDIIDDVTVTYVDVMYFPTAQPTAVITRRVPASQTVVILAEGLVGNTEYRVRTKLVTSPARVIAWSAGGTVTTDAVGPDDITVYLKDLGEDAIAALMQAREDITDMRLRQDMLIRDVVTGETAATKRASLTTKQGRATAFAVQRVDASVTELNGIVTAQASILDSVVAQIESLSGEVAGQATALTTLDARVTSTAGEVEALASAMTGVTAQVGLISGEGLWKMEVRAGSGNVTARLAILMRASINSTAWTEVGTIWETGVTSGVQFSRIANYADQWLVISPYDQSRLPVLVADAVLGTVVMADARIGNLSANKIKGGSLVSQVTVGGAPVSEWNLNTGLWIARAV